MTLCTMAPDLPLSSQLIKICTVRRGLGLALGCNTEEEEGEEGKEEEEEDGWKTSWRSLEEKITSFSCLRFCRILACPMSWHWEVSAPSWGAVALSSDLRVLLRKYSRVGRNHETRPSLH